MDSVLLLRFRFFLTHEAEPSRFLRWITGWEPTRRRPEMGQIRRNRKVLNPCLTLGTRSQCLGKMPMTKGWRTYFLRSLWDRRYKQWSALWGLISGGGFENQEFPWSMIRVTPKETVIFCGRYVYMEVSKGRATVIGGVSRRISRDLSVIQYMCYTLMRTPELLQRNYVGARGPVSTDGQWASTIQCDLTNFFMLMNSQEI